MYIKQLSLEEFTWELKQGNWSKMITAEELLKIEDISIHQGIVFGAYEGVDLIGIAVLDLQYISGFRLPLEIIAVLEAYERTGIGSNLMSHVLKIAQEKEAEALYIRCLPQHDIVSFFMNHGAQDAQRIDAYLDSLTPGMKHLEIKLSQ